MLWMIKRMMPFMNPSELNFSLPSAPAGACSPPGPVFFMGPRPCMSLVLFLFNKVSRCIQKVN